jgi:2-polyprenyl-3-methyl-5-hydroxy-6-metoxy-1,4-benzoquinol methylase
MYERLTECPVCNSANFENYKIVKDHSVSKESFVICKCKSCNFQFTNPRPTEESISSYYDSDDYISHTNKANNLINWIYKQARQYSVSYKLSIINKFSANKNARILDYGCGTGFFLNNAQKQGWQAFGVEPSEQARTIARQNEQATIVSGLSELNLKNKKFQVITLWHVLEHIHRLNEVLQELKGLLKEKGRILIAVPNIESFDQEVFQEYWAAYDVPRHLYHFSPDSMKTLMLKHGLKIKKIYPMKLDAFYISLLSNKYKNSQARYLNSFITGLKSNSAAKSNISKYSSLIYEIKK